MKNEISVTKYVDCFTFAEDEIVVNKEVECFINTNGCASYKKEEEAEEEAAVKGEEEEEEAVSYRIRDDPLDYANESLAAIADLKGYKLSLSDWTLIEIERERIKEWTRNNLKKYATNVPSKLPDHLSLSLYELDEIFYSGIRPRNDEELVLAQKAILDRNLERK